MRPPRLVLVVFAIGFYALAAQTLLFRDFLSAFEGTELAMGGFFSSWLLWLALGAGCAGWFRRQAALSQQGWYLVVLLYLPAFLFQHWLLINARSVLGVEAFEAISLEYLLGFSFLANSLVSFLTGFIFSLACDWSQERSTLPVAWVYAVETLGSFAGATLVTVGLEVGIHPERIFFLSALLLSGCLMSAGISRSASLGGGIAFLLVAVSLTLGLDARWLQWRQQTQWSRLLPREGLQGSFSTPQSEYLYGEYQGEFVVMSWGSVGESLPNEEHAGEVIALCLAQNPQVRRVLIIGQGGLSLSLSLIQLPQMERITWCHFDSEYVRQVLKVLPERFARDCSRIEAPSQDVASFVAESSSTYDLVLLNIPDPTTLVLNRFVTREFVAKVGSSLTENGVLGLRVSGGANYLGPEYAFIGASALSTLRTVFPKVVVKPGEETWLLASRGGTLSSNPGELRDRFAAISGATSIYPPDGLLSLYLPGRAAFQVQKYREIIEGVGSESLVNTEERPHGLLYGLLLLLRTTGLSLIYGIQVFGECGLLILLGGILIYILLRAGYVLRGERTDGVRHEVPLFDKGVLIFCSGLAGISLSVLLLFLYQSRFGSLFLEMGLISGLFMLGIYAGSEGMRWWLQRTRKNHTGLLSACVLVHLALLAGVFHLPSGCPPYGFAILFLGAGIFTGIYVPIACLRAERQGVRAGVAGAWLEAVDNVGGCVGSLFTGVLFIPVLGQRAVLLFLGGLMAAQLVPGLLLHRGGDGVLSLSTFDRRVRVTGYWLFGLGSFCLMSSQLVQVAGHAGYARLFENAARELAGRETELVSHTRQAGDGRTIHYFSCQVSGSSGEHFILDSRDLGASATGYGGPLHLAIRVDKQGTLEGFRVIESRETPSYLRSLENWFSSLTGRSLATPDSMRGVDAVTGATLTSRAVIRTLEQSGQTFASQVLGMVSGPTGSSVAGSHLTTLWRDGFLLTVCFIVALGMRGVPQVWLRRLWLLLMVAVCGVWLNLQFSSQQVFSLLSFRFPVVDLSAAFFLVVMLPVLTLLFGNVYCGHLCPFGALQELIGELRPARLATDPSKRLFRYGRLVKYGLLFVCVLGYSLTGDDSILGVDPLVTIFGRHRESAVIMLAALILAASFFYRRFWCRNLCPAGAFLALLNGVQVLRRWLPHTDPARCDLGVRRAGELDCLCCDRCRHERK